MIEIRDTNGTVLNTVRNPAAVIDIVEGEEVVLLKIGELEEMQEYMKSMKQSIRDTYGPVGLNMIATITCIPLIKNQDLIDKIFNNTGYLRVYLRENQ